MENIPSSFSVIDHPIDLDTLKAEPVIASPWYGPFYGKVNNDSVTVMWPLPLSHSASIDSGFLPIHPPFSLHYLHQTQTAAHLSHAAVVLVSPGRYSFVGSEWGPDCLNRLIWVMVCMPSVSGLILHHPPCRFYHLFMRPTGERLSFQCALSNWLNPYGFAKHGTCKLSHKITEWFRSYQTVLIQTRENMSECPVCLNSAFRFIDLRE